MKLINIFLHISITLVCAQPIIAGTDYTEMAADL